MRPASTQSRVTRPPPPPPPPPSNLHPPSTPMKCHRGLDTNAIPPHADPDAARPTGPWSPPAPPSPLSESVTRPTRGVSDADGDHCGRVHARPDPPQAVPVRVIPPNARRGIWFSCRTRRAVPCVPPYQPAQWAADLIFSNFPNRTLNDKSMVPIFPFYFVP